MRVRESGEQREREGKRASERGASHGVVNFHFKRYHYFSSVHLYLDNTLVLEPTQLLNVSSVSCTFLSLLYAHELDQFHQVMARACTWSIETSPCVRLGSISALSSGSDPLSYGQYRIMSARSPLPDYKGEIWKGNNDNFQLWYKQFVNFISQPF